MSGKDRLQFKFLKGIRKMIDRRAELKQITDRHAKWLRNETGGVKANFDGADLKGVDFSGLSLNFVDFSKANLDGADLREGDFFKCCFAGASLRNAVLKYGSFNDADFSGSDLSGANLTGATLVSAELSSAKLIGVEAGNTDFRDSNLNGADLTDAHARNSLFGRACMNGANFSGADLTDSKLHLADLHSIVVNWQSHELISELLWQAAKGDLEKEQLAAWIARRLDLCWPDFLAIDHPLKEWAIETLLPYRKPNDNFPVKDFCSYEAVVNETQTDTEKVNADTNADGWYTCQEIPR